MKVVERLHWRTSPTAATPKTCDCVKSKSCAATIPRRTPHKLCLPVCFPLPRYFLNARPAAKATTGGEEYPQRRLPCTLPPSISQPSPRHDEPPLSLQSHNLDGTIKISSPVALSALATSYPPSNASFQPALVSSAIIPMLDFLRPTSSYLMLNAYPFFAYIGNSDQIALSYALADPTAPTVVDPASGLSYTSLFDAQYDGVLWAMSHLGYHDIPIDLKPGPTSERNYGLFYPDEENVYDIPLTVVEVGSAVSNGSKVTVVAGAPEPAVAPISALTPGTAVVPTLALTPEPAVAPTSAFAPEAMLTPTLVGQTWCVANENVELERLQAALDYGCGPGGADCGPIRKGYNCYDPNSLFAHASYAFNRYYQLNARRADTCYFGGVAYVVTQQPRFGTCEFPSGY
ncbi:hypothetical protein Droror1_Dr00014767 [Drosera rotundifolia]